MSNKKITMKQYNGTGYDELYPKTTAAQVDGLDSAISSKKDKVTWTKICTVPAGTYNTSATTVYSETIDGSSFTCLKVVFNNANPNGGSLYIAISDGTASTNIYAVHIGGAVSKSTTVYLFRITEPVNDAIFCGADYDTSAVNSRRAYIPSGSNTNVSVYGNPAGQLTGTIDIYYTEDELF